MKTCAPPYFCLLSCKRSVLWHVRDRWRRFYWRTIITSLVRCCRVSQLKSLSSTAPTSIIVFISNNPIYRSHVHIIHFSPILSRLLIYFYIIFYSSAALDDTWGCHQFAVVANFCIQNHYTVISDLYHFYANEKFVTFGAVCSTVAAIKHRKFSLISLSFNIKMKNAYKTATEHQRETRTRFLCAIYFARLHVARYGMCVLIFKNNSHRFQFFNYTHGHTYSRFFSIHFHYEIIKMARTIITTETKDLQTATFRIMEKNSVNAGSAQFAFHARYLLN